MTLEEGEFLLKEGGLGEVAQGFDGGQAEVGGEFAQLGLESGERLKGADEMAAQDMPEGGAEFAPRRQAARLLVRVRRPLGRRLASRFSLCDVQ
jgi:hypothetical protein